MENVGSFNDPGLDEFPDFLAFALLVTITFLVSLGVKVRISVMELFLNVQRSTILKRSVPG